MPKEIYIVDGLPSEDYKHFKNRIISLSKDILDQTGPDRLKINLTLKPAPRMSVIPFKRKKVAVISISRLSGVSGDSVTSGTSGDSGDSTDLLKKSGGFRGGYMVEEAVPVVYEKTWADREPTPGECLLTLFHSKPGLDRDTFLKRWHEGHTPLSLKLHPLWNYNRNVVNKTLSEDSEYYDGIVEEQFQKASDLLNPMVFFGPPLKVPYHMYQVLMDTRSFIDMKRIETYLTTEIHLKS